jgi:hypothetical protein
MLLPSQKEMFLFWEYHKHIDGTLALGEMVGTK